MTTPPQRPEVIERLGMAVYPSFAMLAGMQLDLFTPLADGPNDAEQIAQAIGVGPAKLKPLLYALVSAGLLTVDGSLFSNTPESNHFLVRGKPSYLGGRRQYFADRWNDVLHTAESIQAGIGQTKIDFSAISSDDLESFLNGLHPITLMSGRNLAAKYDFSTFGRLLDVAGGSGGLAIAITEVCPHIQATVMDLPTVTPITQSFVDRAEATSRVKVVTADVVNGPLSGSFDVAVLSSFIQVLSADEARRALKNIGQIIEPGGAIYILGRVLDDSRLSPPETVGFNLVFLNIYDGGQAYTEQEHREWLSEAGFENFEMVGLPNGTSIVNARKPN